MGPLFSSQLSGISIMSVPAEAYVFGIGIWLLIPLMIVIVLVINEIFIPVFYHNHIANCYEVSYSMTTLELEVNPLSPAVP